MRLERGFIQRDSQPYKHIPASPHWPVQQEELPFGVQAVPDGAQPHPSLPQ